MQAQRSRRPYVPIDTCSPAGTWVEEKRYNRVRPTASASRKVLCGNWQEEQVLEADLLALEQAQPRREEGAATTHQDKLRQAASTVSLDVIRDVHGCGRYSGGYESTPYLTRSVASAPPSSSSLSPTMTTTHRADYTSETSDVRALQQPALGVRRQMLLRQALQAAAQAQRTHDAQTLRRQQQHQARRQYMHPRTAVGGYSAMAAAASRRYVDDDKDDDDKDECVDDEDERHASVYMSTIGNGMLVDPDKCADADTAGRTVRTRGRQVLPVIEQLSDTYVRDEAITVYTGNPHTRQVMYMHGKTPADPHGHTRFGKHTYFTERKYCL